MRLTTFAAAYGQQRYCSHGDASTQKCYEQCISYAISEIDLKRFSHELVPTFFSYMPGLKVMNAMLSHPE
jgi:hypothetical protein